MNYYQSASIKDPSTFPSDLFRFGKTAGKELKKVTKTQFKVKGPKIGVFGSARINRDHPKAKACTRLCSALRKSDFHIVTGGNRGMMLYAMEGNSFGKENIGLPLQLPTEDAVNLTASIRHLFSFFFTRKLAFFILSDGFLLVEGGFGSQDELWETIALKIFFKNLSKPRFSEVRNNFPIVVKNSHYHQGLFDFYQELHNLGLTYSNPSQTIALMDDDDAIVSLFRQSVAKEHRQKIKLPFNKPLQHLLNAINYHEHDAKGVGIHGSNFLPSKGKSYKTAVKLAKALKEYGYTSFYIGSGGTANAVYYGYAQSSESFASAVNLIRKSDQGKAQGDVVIPYTYPFGAKVLITTLANNGHIFFLPDEFDLDILFELLTLIQTAKMHWLPLILVDQGGNWSDLIEWMKHVMIPDALIHPYDFELIQLFKQSNVEDIMDILVHP